MSNFNDIIQNKYNEQYFAGNGALQSISSKGIAAFNEMGIPTVKHEEWKYTRISSVLNKDFSYATGTANITSNEVDPFRLPGHENANELVFVNGIYQPQLSAIRSSAEELVIMTLNEAMKGEFKSVVDKHLGHSSGYHKDGIHALSNAFAHQGLLVAVRKNKALIHPLYCYYINDARTVHVLAQPRLLMHVAANAQVTLVEEAVTIGTVDCFTNKVAEVVVEDNAQVEFYKIQNEDNHSSRAVTTHIRQVGVSRVNSVTITLNGGMIRNNLNIIMEAAGCESHMFGLYCVKGNTHIDNHTIVDNVLPNCLSNELYKGILDENATGVFNGKIFVRKDAQKTNAYQSNKNILLGDAASVNTKPQLEIFADDVKCSHGCTVGRLDEDALFYLRARGISEQSAKALLLHAFAIEILDKVKLDPIRTYVDQIISERLDFEI
jgi:Fe-S cluster assembly protein SufD